MKRRRRPLTPFELELRLLRTNYRMWARIPAHVNEILLNTAIDKDSSEAVASVPRPTFPRGVCTGCGCSFADACINELGEGCAWRDRTETRCTSCPPAEPAKKKKRGRRG